MARDYCPSPSKTKFPSYESAQRHAPEGALIYLCRCRWWHLTAPARPPP
jgi:hypothetical protein